MATLFSSLASGSSPTMLYTVTYSQTARTATAVTYSVTVSAILEKPAYSYYNAYVTPKITIGGSSVSFGTLGTFPIGTSTAKTATKSITVTAAATTSSLSYTFSATQSLGGTSSASTGYVSGKTGTIPCSIYATTPSLSGTVALKDGSTTLGTYYRENIGTGTFTLSWPAATGANGTLTYLVRRSIDGASYTDVSTVSSTSLSVQPTSSASYVRFAVKAINTVGSTSVESGWLYSSYYYKNKMSTAPTVTCSVTVTSETGTFAINVGAAKDNLGSTMTYAIAGRSYTTISGTTTISTGSRIIYTNNGTSGTYITLDNLKKAALAGTTHSDTSTYKGTLDFTVTATNAYGSTSSVNFSVPIDLGKDASISTTPSLSVNSSSYYTISSNKYLFPQYKSISLSIPAAITDSLGRYCSFDVYISESSGDRLIKNTGIITSSSGTTVSISSTEANMSTSSKTVSFYVKAKTYNGVTKDSSATSSLVLHYYKKPTVSYSAVTRSASAASFKVSIKSNSSLSGATNTSTITSDWTKGTSTTSSTTETYTVSRSSLTETFTQTVTVTVRDSIGYVLQADGTNDVSTSVLISPFQPGFSIREKGVGVNCIPSGEYQFEVNGTANITSDLDVNGRIIATSTDVITSEQAYLKINTTHDGNDMGDGYTHLGYYNSDGKYNHYFRGTGWTYINTTSGMLVTGTAKLNSSLTVAGDSTLSSTLGVTGAVTLSSTLGVTGATTLSSTLGVTGATTLSSSLTVAGETTLSGNLTVTGITNFSATTRIGAGYFEICPYNTSSYGSDYKLQSYYDSNNTRLIMMSRHMSDNTSTGLNLTLSGGELTAGSVTSADANYSGGGFFTTGSNGTFAANSGYLVLRSVADSYVYIQGYEMRVVAPNTTATYRAAYASSFTNMSTGTSKMNIRTIDDDSDIDSMQILKNTDVYTYHLTDEVERGIFHNKKIGLIAEATPTELKVEGEQAIDLYCMISTLWDVCKKQQECMEKQQEQIEELWEALEATNA